MKRTSVVRQRGFTLLEVVLALTPLAIIAGICYAAFHVAMRAVERGEVAVVTAQRLRVAADVFSRQMKSIIKYPVMDWEAGEPVVYCKGTATSWTFVTSVSQNGGSAYTRVIYQVLDDPPRLAMTETSSITPSSLATDPIDVSGEKETILLDGFTTLEFQYMIDDGSGETEWVSE